jgi:transposase
VWTVLASVEEMDLTAFFEEYRPDGHGRPAYDPRVVVALLFYACAQGVRASRAIERKCREDVAFMVITAMRVPDHSTIAEFRKRHERALAGLFGHVLGMCEKAGLVKVGVIAIDGTKISANASMGANRSYERIARELLDEIDETDRREDEMYGQARGDELPEQLCTPDGRRAALREAKHKLDTEREAAGNEWEAPWKMRATRTVRSSGSSRSISIVSGSSTASRAGGAGCARVATSWMSCVASRRGRSQPPGPTGCGSQSAGSRRSIGSSLRPTPPMRHTRRAG